MNGEVKSYSPQHGYGFITKDGVDFFFHAHDWTLRIPPCEGLRVQFDPQESDKGMKASNVRKEK